MKKMLLTITLLVSYTITQAITETDIMRRMRDDEIEFVSFVFSDLLGNLKELIVPAEHVPNALEHGLNFDGSSVPGCTAITESDMLLKPDLNTFTVIPWTQDELTTARIVCDLYLSENEPYTGDPRYLLKTILKQAKDMGYEFFTGPELEFFLFTNDNGSITPCDNNKYFDVETDIGVHLNKRELLHALRAQGVDAEKLHHEVAPGQHEFSLKYGKAIDIADQIVIGKQTVKSFARQWGLYATFMPKPIYGENGSGMHIHFSLYDIANNRNAFYDANDSMYLSKTAKQYIAGVLKYVKEFTAILDSTINSYKRLVPGYEAPIYMCWGMKNRSAMIRIPRINADQVGAARAELRSPDALCNPYLSFAIILMAGLEGIKQNLDTVPPVEDNLYKLSIEEIMARGITLLPSSLNESVALLEQSTFVQTTLGKRMFSEFLKAKKKELLAFNTAVTDWEIKQYR